MKDLKLKKEWSGGWADYLLCETKRKDVGLIDRGFPITTVVDKTKAIWQQLVSRNGEIAKRHNDYSVRKGLFCANRINC